MLAKVKISLKLWYNIIKAIFFRAIFPNSPAILGQCNPIPLDGWMSICLATPGKAHDPFSVRAGNCRRVNDRHYLK